MRGVRGNPDAYSIGVTGWDKSSFRCSTDADWRFFESSCFNFVLSHFDINTIGNMQPGEGYQIYVNAASTLTYPANRTIVKSIAAATNSLSPAVRYKDYCKDTGYDAILLVHAQLIRWHRGRRMDKP